MPCPKIQNMSKAELIEALEHFRHREVLFNATEAVAHIGHYEWDNEKDCLSNCSEEYARLYGMSVEEIMAAQSGWEKMLEQIHADDRESFRKKIKALGRTGSFDLKYRIIRSDGKILHIHEFGVINADKSNRSPGNYGIIQDITELTKHERDLEYRDALTQQAEEITELGYFNFDLESEKYNFISEGFARIHGVSRKAYLQSVNSRDDDMSDVHPDDYERLATEYRNHQEAGSQINIDYRIFRADGEIRWIREIGKVLRSADGRKPESLGVLQDITPQKEAETQMLEAQTKLELTVQERTRELAETVIRLQEEIAEREKISAELKYLADHDALTGLPSLRLCKDRLERSLIESRRNQQMTAILFVDLDGFKAVNDSYGHEFGDIVLKVTADRIKAEIRETDTVARIGGDEFVVIMSRLPDIGIVQRIAGNLIEQVSQVIHINQQEVAVGASLGIALYPEDGTTAEELIRQADRAMYRVKNSGKNNFAFSRSQTLN